MKKEILLPALCALIIVYAAAYLIADHLSVISHEGIVIGEIFFEKNTAERRYSDQVIWEKLAQKSPLYNRDLIRTAGDSLAVIRFNNKQELELDENTMILLDLEKSGVRIDFSEGSIHARGGGVDGGQAINIVAKDMNVQFGSGSAYVFKKGADGYSVDVTGGEAVIMNNNKSVKVGKNQSASLDGKGISVNDNPVKYIAPAPNLIHIAPEADRMLDFEWATEVKGLLTLQISASREFKHLAHSSRSADNSRSVRLKPGTYYWRVLTPDGKTGFAQRFTVLQEKPPVGLTPKTGAVEYYVTSPPAVKFQWKPSRAASSYMLEVASDHTMKNMVMRKQCFSNSITLDTLNAGNYFWRAVNLYGTTTSSGISGIPVKFQVIKIDRPLPVELSSPVNNASFTEDFMKTNPTVFSWAPGNGIKEYFLEISSTTDFKKEIYSFKTAGTHHKLTKSLKKGPYYWRVSGVGDRGVKVDPSPTRLFSVNAIMPVKQIQPSEGEVIMQHGSGIVFRWNDPNRWNNYRVDISSDNKFNGILKSQKSTDPSVTIEGLNAGRLFWRISLLDTAGKAAATGVASGFYIPAPLPQPKIISPLDKSLIDMAMKDSLNFAWGKVPGAAAYRVKLIAVSGTLTAPVFERELAATRYFFDTLTMLDRGIYCFEIQAVAYLNGAVSALSPSGKIFFTVGLTREPAVPELITPGVIYVK